MKKSPIPYTLDLKFSWSNKERHLIIQPLYWGVMMTVIVITISLGLWQLDRAKQKEALLITTQEHEQDSISVSGHFQDSFTLLLDNQTHRGQAGYEVIQIFQMDSQSPETDLPKKLLINRGWIAASPDRTQLPYIAISNRSVDPQSTAIPQRNEITIQPAALSSRSPANNIEKLKDQIFRLQALNLNVFQELNLPNQYYKLIQGNHRLMTDHWQAKKSALSSSPDKHIGYAIQWFLMSFAATAILFFSSLAVDPESLIKESISPRSV